MKKDVERGSLCASIRTVGPSVFIKFHVIESERKKAKEEINILPF